MIMIFCDNADIFNLVNFSHYNLIGSFNDSFAVVIRYFFLKLLHQISYLLFENSFELLIKAFFDQRARFIIIKCFAFFIFDPTDGGR